MNGRDGYPHIIDSITSVLALVGSVLIAIGFADGLGQVKTFRFFIGEMAVITMIGYSFQMACGRSKFAPFGIAIWFCAATLNFVKAVWFTTQ